jgi:hypothetical protein
MDLPSYFNTFLTAIRLDDVTKWNIVAAHQDLTSRIKGDTRLADCVVSTFLQGSYRRGTIVRPDPQKRADVDVVIVTKLARDQFTPQQVLDLIFRPFLDREYPGRWEPQERSMCIHLDGIDIDLVPTSAPSEEEWRVLRSKSVTATESLEDTRDWQLSPDWVPLSERGPLHDILRTFRNATSSEEWRASPLYIPDRQFQQWKPTHPIAQIEWTSAKNARTSGNYINVVKAIRWSRRVIYAQTKHPKGYPLEHMVGDCCPDDITSVGDGVARSLENMVDAYRDDVMRQTLPFLPDRGVPTHNVLGRLSFPEFSVFYYQVQQMAQLARSATNAEDIPTSAQRWRQLFGELFPLPRDVPGFTPRTAVSNPSGGRFG